MYRFEVSVEPNNKAILYSRQKHLVAVLHPSTIKSEDAFLREGGNVRSALYGKGS